MPKFLTNIDLQNNELQNARVQSLATAPPNPVAGRIYFDTTLNAFRCFDGTAWKTMGEDGVKTIEAGSGLTGGGSGATVTISHDNTSDQASVSKSARTYVDSITLDDFGHVTGITTSKETVTDTTYTLGTTAKTGSAELTLSGSDSSNASVKFIAGIGASVSSDGSGNITISATGVSPDYATSETAGIIKLATSAQVTAGTDSTVAVTPSTLKTELDKKVSANAAITGKTATKITYDSKGLVTSGGSLSVSDIPDLPLSKIPSITVDANKINFLNGVTSDVQAQLNSKAAATDLSDFKTEVSSTYATIAALNTEQSARETADNGLDTRISAIEGKIPTQASTSNQLADKDFVNSSITSISAEYITSNANGDAFPSKSKLTTGPYYHQGATITLSKNDYALVLSDETQGGASTRYVYDGKQWDFQYKVNDTPFTSEQVAAINSGITSDLVTQISTNASNISSVTTRVGTAESNITALQQSVTSLSNNKTDKFVGTITGNATTTTFTITHNLGTREVVVSVYDHEYEEVIVDIVRNSANTIQCVFGTAPAASDTFTVVVIG